MTPAPPPPARKLVAALDVGSSKVSAMIAEPGEDGRLKILGTGQRESRGVKRGFIADMEKSETAIREAVEQAERIAGTNIDQVFVGFSAGGLVSDVAHRRGRDRRPADRRRRYRRLARRGPQRDRSRRADDPPRHAGALHDRRHERRQASRAASMPTSSRVDIHVVAADPAPVKNLDLCVRSAHLGVEAIVASPVAAGKACLSDEERELGVALVELGAGVTNVSVFAGGMLVGLESLPIGGSDITDDIAAAFGTRRAEAERIKCFYGSAMTSPRDNHDMIELAPIAGGQEGMESRAASPAPNWSR